MTRGGNLNRKVITGAATASIRSSHCGLANGMKKDGTTLLSYGANDGRKGMTLDELKAEAKRQGYKLIKDNPMPKMLPCICGANSRTEWTSASHRGYCYECMKCGKMSSWGYTRREAQENWNRMVTDEAGRTD